MIRNLIIGLVLLGIVYLQILFTSSEFWILKYLDLIAICGLVFLSKGKIWAFVILMLFGNVLIDISVWNTIAVKTFAVSVSLLLVNLLTRYMSILENFGISTKTFVVLFVYIFIYNLYLMLNSSIDFGQLLVNIIVNSVLYVTLILFISLFTKSNNAFQVKS